MVVTALLGLGAEEIVLVLLLFLVLFGAQKVPELARSLGKARAELERAQREVRETMRTDEERALDEQLMFERAREHQVAQQDAELLQLRRAAEELGLPTQGRSAEELRAAIAGRVAPAGRDDTGTSGHGR